MSDMSDNFQLDLNGEKIDEDHDYFLPEGFIEAVEFDPYLHYSDTDSAHNFCVFLENNQIIDTETLFNRTIGRVSTSSKDYFVKELKSLYKTYSVNEDFELELKTIKYIMKHKVKKEMYKIDSGSNSVIVTCDHSLITSINKKLKETIPADVTEDDNIIKLILDNNGMIPAHILETKEFTITSLGIQEEWVYDIEVEDNHNFFANNILLHNSSYQEYILPFDKYDDVHKTVEYVQGIANKLRKQYNNALEHYGKFANLDNEYNTMDFKAEVVAGRGFFAKKKFYGLGKMWDEGTFFEDKLKMKKTGGAIIKSDTTELSKELLTEIYNLIVLDTEQTDLYEMYRHIFIVLKNKYIMQIQDDIKELNFKKFSIPKKWGNTKKTIPPFVHGAMLYNALMGSTFRPADSFIVVKINIDVFKLIEYFKNNKIDNDKYTMTLATVEKLKNKINNISIPPDLTEEDKNKLLKLFDQLDIKLDVAEIIDNNVLKKIEPFDELFSDDIRMQIID